MEELRTRVINCKHWHWLVGMRHIDDLGATATVIALEQQGSILMLRWADERVNDLGQPVAGQAPASWCRPYLTDPATKGCVLELVRKAYGDPSICVHTTDSHEYGVVWMVVNADGETLGAGGYFEEEALVSALEAAHP